MAIFSSLAATLGASTVAGTGLFGTSLATTIGGATALAAGAGAAYGVSGMMQQPSTPEMPKSDIKAPEAPKMEDANKKAQKQAEDQRRAAARSTSVKTNPLGIKDEAVVARKKLLGG